MNICHMWCGYPSEAVKVSALPEFCSIIDLTFIHLDYASRSVDLIIEAVPPMGSSPLSKNFY